MSCGCTNINGGGNLPDETAPPTIESQLSSEECEGTAWSETPCVSGDNVSSQQSAGSVLDAKLTDAGCQLPDEGLVILARKGSTLKKFAGNGFIQFIGGLAFVKKFIPVVVSQLWHRQMKLDSGGTVAMGDPFEFKYGVVADKFGNLYGIQGLQDKDSVRVWNNTTKAHETWPLSKLPKDIQAALPQSEHVELVGYEEVPVSGDPTAVRSLKALCGEGIVYLCKVPVAPTPVPEGCTPCGDENFAYVAKVLTFPNVPQVGESETGRHRLIFSNKGLHWEMEDGDGNWEDVPPSLIGQ